MIEVKTYLKKGMDFIDVFYFEGSIDDQNYIEGGLILHVNGKEIINLEMWDYIDQLWAYISNGLKEVSEGRDFETNFPDQPITIRLKPIRNEVLLTIICHATVKVVVDKSYFIAFMTKNALSFFEQLSTFKGIDEGYYSYEISTLKQLMKR